jgi:Icc-related predicted phosphoesterase
VLIQNILSNDHGEDYLMKIFFATDVHGSEICWKKFLAASKFYDADTLILGGDMTGKAIIPIIAQGKVSCMEKSRWTRWFQPSKIAVITRM